MTEKTIKIKAVVLLFFGCAVFAVLLTGRSFVQRTEASPNGAPAARTGAPGELTCTDCHNNGTGAGQFTITAPATYTPGQTYQIQVRHTTSDTTRKRWGFQLTSLAAGAMAGSFASTTANTNLKTGNNGRNYIGQTTAGTFANQVGQALWSFNWTAPATNVGAVTMYASGIQANNDGAETGDQLYLKNVVIQPPAVVAATHTASDFDGDGKTDPAIIRDQGGAAIWYSKTTTGTQAQQFGLSTDKFLPADYDGDGKTDPTVFRNGAWWSFRSSTGTIATEQFGAAGDIPVQGDFDADGKGDLCVFREGVWWIKSSANGAVTARQWGNSTDHPITGDFDGDGKSDYAIFRTSESEWWISRSSNGTSISIQFGITGDIPVPADYDGDHSTNIAVFRPSEGRWYTSTDVNNNYYGSYNWGLATDIPVPGDFDGDGKADVAVFRDGTWYIRNSTNGGLNVQFFGLSTDTAVPKLYIQ